MQFPLLALPAIAQVSPEATETAGPGAVGQVLFVFIAAIVVVQLISFGIASKFLGGEEGGFGKGALTWVAQAAIQLLTVVSSVLLGVNKMAAGLLATVLFGFFLSIWVAAKIHGIGVVRAFFMTLLASFLSVALIHASAVALGNTSALEKFADWAKGKKNEEPAPAATVEPPKPQAPQIFASEKDAQAAAVAKYPALGVAGSAFNKAFVEKHAKLRQENSPLLKNPGWPMEIAAQVAGELPPSQP